LSIAAHPEIKPFSKASPESIEQTNREVGSIVTRILTVDCPVELKRATKNDPMALQTAFEWLGRVAMQELMTNQSVTQAISAYGKYVDQEKVNQLLLSK
jgi:hypothetical protein